MVARVRTYKERMEREEQIRALIDEGLSQRQIAERLGGITPQAVAKFLRVRGLQTRPAAEREARIANRLP